MATIAERIYYCQTKEYDRLCQFSCGKVVSLDYFAKRKAKFILPKRYKDADREKELAELDREMRANKAPIILNI